VFCSNGRSLAHSHANAAPHTHPRFEKIFGAFYKSKGMAPNSVVFKFNGETIEADATPDSLEMEEGDVVDAFLQQTGGGW
jgi:small ubiquitin-related modifier